MDDRETAVLDERAIGATLTQYCRAVDDRRFDHVAALFTDDARLHTMGRTLAGRAAIREFFGPMPDAAPSRPASAHVLSNVVVELDGDAAIAESDWMMLTREESGATVIALAGRYRDRLERVGDRWRIAERSVVALARPRPAGESLNG